MDKLSKANRMIVLHFVGAGRSGSTLLNIMLDNHPNIISTGELAFFAQSLLNGDYCSCKRPLSSCLFWSQIKDEWLKRTGMSDLKNYLHLQRQWERYRSLPLFLLNSFARKNNTFKQYQAYTAQLYAIIQEYSDAIVIADSSKNPVRALVLGTIPEVDLRLILLVRDIRGYVWSRQKAFSKNQKVGLGRTDMPTPVWKSAIKWILINLLSEWVGKASGKFLLVRYEDLVKDTKSIFAEIGALVEQDLSSLAASISKGEGFSGRHVQAGNRLRMQQNIILKPGSNWQESTNSRQQILLWILGGWLMRRYGYN